MQKRWQRIRQLHISPASRRRHCRSLAFQPETNCDILRMRKRKLETWKCYCNRDFQDFSVANF